MPGAYETLLARATADAAVMAVILGGSRGKGFETDRSDWDVYIVTTDDADPAEVRSRYEEPTADEIDLALVETMTGFAAYALHGHHAGWSRYTFAHLTPPFDRTGGEIAALCAAKEFFTPEVAHERAALVLDGYINSSFRGLKNRRDGRQIAGHFDAAESVPYLIDFAFDAEGRARPYNKYLGWELDHHPLQEGWLSDAYRSGRLRDVITGNDRTQQAVIFREVEAAARRLGYGEVLDAWHATDLVALRG